MMKLPNDRAGSTPGGLPSQRLAIGALCSLVALGAGCSEGVEQGAAHAAFATVPSGASSTSAQAWGAASEVLATHPDPTIGSRYFLPQPNLGGNGSSLLIAGVHWGRLVQVADHQGTQQLRDFLISDGIRDGDVFQPSHGAALAYGLQRNPVTGQFTLTIPAKAGTIRFKEALENVEANFRSIVDQDLDVNELGPFSMIPRNATIALEFQDLLEPAFEGGTWNDAAGGQVANPISGQLAHQVLRVLTGSLPDQPFDARVFCDPNHGNLADLNSNGTPEFYSTRVLIAPVVTWVDAQSSNPPLPVNALGFPESVNMHVANLGLRIPTVVVGALGQTQILRNPSGNGLAYVGNGNNDNSSGTFDVVRAMRSGGSTTQDPFNGFLFDDDSPQVIGSLGTTIVGTPVADPQLPGRFSLPLIQFDVDACATSIEVGDMITQAQPQGQVVGVVRAVDSAGSPSNVVVDVLVPANAAFTAGPARLQTTWEAGVDEPACFVRFSPAAGQGSAQDVSPNAGVWLQFSEPMDVSTLTAFDGFSIQRAASLPFGKAFDYAIGEVIPSADQSQFLWSHPALPFSHTAGVADGYRILLDDSADGPADLAGNRIASGDQLPPVGFRLDPNAPEQVTGGFAMRFDDVGNEIFPNGQLEIRQAQLLFDFDAELVRPRAVKHFSATADRHSLLPGRMTPFVGGVQTPLSSLGSKLQSLWRYADVGFSVSDEAAFNVDIEGISWSPVGGNVAADVYDEFQIGLTHSKWLPDEYLDPMSGFPRYGASGVKPPYDANLNDPIGDPMKVVHPKQAGYLVSPLNLYTSASGTPMLPYPLNEGLDPEDHKHYTWRDTAMQALGGGIVGSGNTGNGVPLDAELLALGLDPATPKDYQVGQVPSVGLPILMELRCYPSSQALGLNSLDVSLAVTSSPRPNFRAFSTGGVGTDGLPHNVYPDAVDIASGGYNPASIPPGAHTPGTDNTFYMGELALVTRVSRAHSMWFDSGPGNTAYAEPVIEPRAADQAPGTSVSVVFRGALAAPPSELVAGAPGGNPNALTAYGDSAAGDAISFLGDNSWHATMGAIDTARWFQFRLTFISNAATGESPELSTLAIGYSKQ